MAYENIIADENTRPDTKAKVTGYLIKLKSDSHLPEKCFLFASMIALQK